MKHLTIAISGNEYESLKQFAASFGWTLEELFLNSARNEFRNSHAKHMKVDSNGSR